MPVFLDKPAPEIGEPCIDVYGWAASQDAAPAIRVTANGRSVRHILHDRPDVRRSLPEQRFVAGVHAPLDLGDLDPCDTVEISLACGGDETRLRCRLSAVMQQARAAETTLRRAAHDKCRSLMVCPSCAAPALRARVDEDPIVCPDCGEVFSQPASDAGTPAAIDMRPDRLGRTERATAIDNIGLWPDSAAARALIARVTANGGWVLAHGTGQRGPRSRHVVTVGAVDDGRADVLAGADALPFPEHSFEAAITLGALDRMPDPLAGARALLRVVKPGGELLVGVPAMRPVPASGAPAIDLTAQGLRALFAEGAEVLSTQAPAGADAAGVVQSLLRAWLSELPDAARDAVAAMTVGAAAIADPAAWSGGPHAAAPPAGLPDACMAMLLLRRR